MKLNQHQQRIQQHINQLLESRIDSLEGHAAKLKQAMGYALLNGGKRMRPFLVYATGEMLGAASNDLDPIAMALECIHSYSLVHDDLPAMDNDEFRRGKPTCHIAFDEATAILAGDALQSLAFEILAEARLSLAVQSQQVKLIHILTQAAGYAGMCGGQAMDLAATNSSINQIELAHLHQLKTGALIKAAILMAVLVAPRVNTKVKKHIESFANALGLAFQVQDDILDVIGDSDVLGKPQGSDQAQNKSTYPALLGLDESKSYLGKLHQQALHDLAALPYNTELLRAFTDYTVSREF